MSVSLSIFGLTALLGLVSLLQPLAARLQVPFTVLLAAAGCAIGAAIEFRPEGLWAPFNDLLNALDGFEISSEAFIAIFLPALVFEAALGINLRRLMDDIVPILTLAVIAVLVCCAVVGAAMSVVAPFSLLVCVLLGAIVAPTDPAAVIGVFREVGAPRRLSLLVEGESLLNDAAAIALFGLVIARILTGEGPGPLATVFDALWSAVLAVVVGVALAFAANQLFRLLQGWPRAEITLTITLAYLSFFVAEHYFHAYGVVACVSAGLTLSATARTKLSPETAEQLEGAWGQLGFWANSLVFVLASMFVPGVMDRLTWTDVGYIVAVYVSTLVARAGTIYLLLPLLSAAGLTQRIGNNLKAVILWGGLRGAVSLALALAVLENKHIPEEIRNFIATSVTGYVLLTLLINGTTLRMLIRLLKLDRLTPMERGVMERAVAMILAQVRDQVGKIAREERIDRPVADLLMLEFETKLTESRASGAQVEAGPRSDSAKDETMAIGLAMLAAFEGERSFALLKAGVIDRRLAETMLSNAQRLAEAIRALGTSGHVAAWRLNLGYSRRFRSVLFLQNRLGIERPLAAAIADRFEMLINLRLLLAEMLPFCRDRMASLLGGETAGSLAEIVTKRAADVDAALGALKLQYPTYAEALQRQHLGRLAREMEREGYHGLFQQGIIGGDIQNSLEGETDGRWPGLDRRPRLDTGLTAIQLIDRVPMFHDLDKTAQARIARLLKPHLVLPDSRIIARGEIGHDMYFIASGAVRVDIPGHPVELGSGAFFGELALLTGQRRSADVVALAFCRLLRLAERDFHALVDRDPALKQSIEAVAQERMRPS